MEHTNYGLRALESEPSDRAVELATDALKAEGFGVLTTIDVKTTLKEKLDRDVRRYVILGACNPALAERALHAELGVLRVRPQITTAIGGKALGVSGARRAACDDLRGQHEPSPR